MCRTIKYHLFKITWKIWREIVTKSSKRGEGTICINTKFLYISLSKSVTNKN